jgi:imidazolonepropionase
MKCAYPPARKLIDAGACVALATDYNPGSCPSQDLSLVGLLARLEMKMTLPEVFSAYTIGAAKALGISEVEGSLEVGKSANFICTEADLSDFFYSAGHMPEHTLFIC